MKLDFILVIPSKQTNIASVQPVVLSNRAFAAPSPDGTMDCGHDEENGPIHVVPHTPANGVDSGPTPC